MTEYKVIVAGSRSIKDRSIVREVMHEQDVVPGSVDEVVHGGSEGVDSLAGVVAENMKMPVKRFPADWSKHGKAAGPIRNEEMAQYADALVAIWDGESRGTKDMIDKALDYGLDVYVKVVE